MLSNLCIMGKLGWRGGLRVTETEQCDGKCSLLIPLISQRVLGLFQLKQELCSLHKFIDVLYSLCRWLLSRCGGY